MMDPGQNYKWFDSGCGDIHGYVCQSEWMQWCTMLNAYAWLFEMIFMFNNIDLIKGLEIGIELEMH